MRADSQTDRKQTDNQTYIHTDMLIAILHPPAWGELKMSGKQTFIERVQYIQVAQKRSPKPQ